MVKSVLVLGAGSAGLLAAVTLKRKIPHLQLRIVRSPDIGVIGVGEGTTPNFPRHLFEYLGLSRKVFHEMAQPTWKIGIRLIWGKRPHFDYGFSQALDAQWSDLPRANGFFCDQDFTGVDITMSLMQHAKVFLRNPQGGGPDIQPWHGYHIENKKFVDMLEFAVRNLGCEIIDANVAGAPKGPEGISGITLDDGRTLTADLYLDASGFRSELLGKTLQEPYLSFGKTLFCDRAVVGGWARTDEPILPHTTAETMDAGWCWRIEHENFINRGYVYSSAHISDDAARAEFLRKNPKAPPDGRIVKFRSGRYQRTWVDNVIAIGNSCGFVEPLEASALMVICDQCRTLTDLLLHTGCNPTPTIRNLYNRTIADVWDEIRDFLGLHYWGNSRLDTPFWQHCRRETDLSGIGELLEFYAENGPTGFCRSFLKNAGINFGIEGFLVMLVGNRIPYQAHYTPTEAERQTWARHRMDVAQQAQSGLTVKQALEAIRQPHWALVELVGPGPTGPRLLVAVAVRPR